MQQIIYALLNYLNGSLQEDTNSHLAKTLLSHLSDIPHLSLVEAADLCGVSVATLNRFCRLVGYHNYSTLRELIQESQPLPYPSEIKKDFSSRLSANLTHIENIPLSTLDQAVDTIHHASHIYLVGYGDFQFAALYFQKHLYSHGKFSQIFFNGNLPLEKLKQVQPDDLIILTSLQLEYMDLAHQNRAKQLIQSLNCHKILITQSHHQAVLALFDTVLNCGPQLDKDLKIYTILHIYDRLILRYHEKYHPYVYE